MQNPLVPLIERLSEPVALVNRDGGVVCWSQGARSLLGGPLGITALPLNWADLQGFEGGSQISLPDGHTARWLAIGPGWSAPSETLFQLPLAVVELSWEGRPVTWSQEAARLFGAAALTEPFAERLAANERVWFAQAVEDARAGRRSRGVLSVTAAALARSYPVVLQPLSGGAGMLLTLLPESGLGSGHSPAGDLTSVLGGVSHDLNNALMAVSAGLGNEGPVDPGQVQFARVGLRVAMEVGKDLATFAHGPRDARPEPVSVAAIAKDVAAHLTAQSTQGVQVRLNPVPGDLWVNAEPGLALRVLTAVGEHCLSQLTFGDQLVVGARLVADRVLLSVSHDGKMLDPRELSRVFEPFGVVRAGTQAGRGLSLIHTMARLHGGELTVTTEHAWTRFYLGLPVSAARPMRLEMGDGSPELRILLVDDEPLVLRSLARMLKRKGHQVWTAADAQEALVLIRDEPAINLGIFDLVMPGMDGEELLKVVRSQRPELPVMMMTGYSRSERLDSCLRAGAIGALRKPFTYEDIDEAVRRQAAT